MGRIIELTNAGSTVKVDKYALAVDSIKAIAKPSNGDGCIVYLVGDKFLVKESYDEVKKMMEREALISDTEEYVDIDSFPAGFNKDPEESVDEKQDESCY